MQLGEIQAAAYQRAMEIGDPKEREIAGMEFERLAERTGNPAPDPADWQPEHGPVTTADYNRVLINRVMELLPGMTYLQNTAVLKKPPAQDARIAEVTTFWTREHDGADDSRPWYVIGQAGDNHPGSPWSRLLLAAPRYAGVTRLAIARASTAHLDKFGDYQEARIRQARETADTPVAKFNPNFRNFLKYRPFTRHSVTQVGRELEDGDATIIHGYVMNRMPPMDGLIDHMAVRFSVARSLGRLVADYGEAGRLTTVTEPAAA